MVLPKRAYNSEKRQAKAQKTRAAILVAAKRLFASKGFDEVTIEDIAVMAEVSAPTIYALFQSKSGVVRAMIDVALPQEHYESIIQELEMEKKSAQKLEERIIEATKNY